jgi:Domain of unknown function (DUF5666)
MTMSSCDLHRRSWQPNRVAALLLVLLLAACGGGVDSGGTGAPASSASTSSSASGPITGFGSVIVNDVHFDESNASITDGDGTVRQREDLKLGMTTVITGSALVVGPDDTRSVADSIVFSSAILGPVDNIDAASGTMTVLGQLVDVSATTVFDDSLSGGIAALSAGDVVEIYALFDASNAHYAATRVESKSGVLAYELRGVVSNLDTRGKAFNIGSLRVSYAGIASRDVPSTLDNGELLRVRTQTSPGTPVRATRLQDATTTLPEQEETSIEGLIIDFISMSQFGVDGVRIDASQAKLSGHGGLGLGRRVRIEGAVHDGVLVATTIQSKTQSDVEIEGFELDGMVTAIDTAHKILSLRGVSVDYSGAVDFRGGSIGDLRVGRNVQINGTLSSDRTGLRAVRIKLKH